ncbi:MAG: PDZ domain-containing protein [Lewinellaceae bacterium]|nr:PDZ domain-containing protein [Lewinellaceae bacterium]
MITKYFYITLFLILIRLAPVAGQGGFVIPARVQQVDIPFDFVNNFIIVNLVINNTLTLRMIFDTGAEHTILSKREISDVLNVPYEREFRLMGADLKTEIVAYLARKIRFDVPNVTCTAPAEDILILQEDYFRFEEYAGVSVHGILSAKSFANYIFKINYQKKVISLYNRNEFPGPDARYKKVPVQIYRNKIYLNTKASFQQGTQSNVKLLLDTGAALPLLFFTNTDTLVQPPGNALKTNIGMGLGGYLEGYIGRTEGLDIGSFHQKGIVTYFQEIDTTQDPSALNGRHGLIGNMMLNRFQIIIDYSNSSMWFSPSNKFEEKYVFDRSGMTLIAGGKHLNKISVLAIIPGSPADEADIRPGDRILRLGIIPASYIGLPTIMHILQKKPGKKIRLTISRDGKRLKKHFRLRDLI